MKYEKVIIEIKDLVKEYKGGIRANDSISLTVNKGEVFGLLGPNGAGKSTMLSQLIGLLTPTSGKIVLGGIDIISNPEYARKVCSFQPQNDVPIDGLTVLQAIELTGRLRGGNKVSVKKHTRELINALEIGQWANRQGQTLSGGVKRLVGYCMTVVYAGDIVILDEPTNDVDPLRRRKLWEQIRSVADSGITVLLVTHNVLEAERVVDRLAIIDKGKILCSGTPASLKGSGMDKLRLELILMTDTKITNLPCNPGTIRVGRRLRTIVEQDEIERSIEWAKKLKSKGIVEEFSVSPTSLEDVYVKMIGRADIIGDTVYQSQLEKAS
ncbi:ABC transporter ATP-binding protein [Actinomycetota bacterium]